MKLTIKTTITVGILMSLCLGQIPAQAKEIKSTEALREMPQQAVIALATQPIDAINKKVGSFSQEIGVANPEEPFDIKGLLTSSIAEMGVNITIDGSRGVGLAVLNPMANPLLKIPVLFLPVADAQNALNGLKKKTAAGQDIWQTADDMFVRASGKYLLLAEKAEILTTIAPMPKGINLTEHDRKIFSQSDAAVVINMTSLTPMMRMMAMMFTAGEQAQKHPALGKMTNLFVERICEMNTISVGAKLGSQGVNLKYNIQAKKGSTLAQHLTNHPLTDLAPLAKLPGQDHIFAYAFNFDNKAFGNALTSIIDILRTDTTVQNNIKPAEFDEIKNLTLKMLELNHQGSVAMYPSPDTPKSGTMLGRSIYIANMKNNREILAQTAQMSGLTAKIMAQFGVPVKLTYKKAAGQIDGITYDEMDMEMSAMVPDPEAKKALQKMYGDKMTITQQYCTMNDLLLGGTGKGTLEQAIAMIKNQTTTLDKNPGIVKAAQNLPSHANAFGFIDFAQYMQFALGMAFSQTSAPQGDETQQMQNTITDMLKQIKGTIGFSITLADGRLQNDIFIPNELIQSASKTVMGLMLSGLFQPPSPSEQTGPDSQPQNPPPFEFF